MLRYFFHMSKFNEFSVQSVRIAMVICVFRIEFSVSLGTVNIKLAISVRLYQ